VLCFLFVVTFLFAGSAKLFSVPNAELHARMVKDSVKWERLWYLPAPILLFLIGFVEVGTSVLRIVALFKRWKRVLLGIACAQLVIMIGAVITHVRLSEPSTVALAFAALLSLEIVLCVHPSLLHGSGGSGGALTGSPPSATSAANDATAPGFTTARSRSRSKRVD